MTEELRKQADEFLRLQKLRVEARGSLARDQIAHEIYDQPISWDALIKALADELRGKDKALKEISRCGSYNAAVIISMHALGRT